MTDSAALLVELRGRIAAKSNWGRQELLVLMAELEGDHQVPEDELDRAVRLVMPRMLDLLFNRGPLADAVREAVSGGAPAPEVTEDLGLSHAEGAHPSMAA